MAEYIIMASWRKSSLRYFNRQKWEEAVKGKENDLRKGSDLGKPRMGARGGVSLKMKKQETEMGRQVEVAPLGASLLQEALQLTATGTQFRSRRLLLDRTAAAISFHTNAST